MRILTLAMSLLLIFTVSVFAQNGSIGVFSAIDGTDCNLLDNAPGLLHVYVVQVGDPCSQASEFAVAEGGGFTGTKLFEVFQFALVLGNTTDGASVSYQGPQSPPVYIVDVAYSIVGTSASCSWIKVVDNPNTGGIFMTDCASDPVGGNKWQITGGTAIVNDDGSCSCNVPTQPSTWGKIKSLYQ